MQRCGLLSPTVPSRGASPQLPDGLPQTAGTGHWMDNYSNRQTNTQTREAASGSHVTTRSHAAISPPPQPGALEEDPPAPFRDLPCPARVLRSVLPATRCPQTPGSSSAAVRASFSLLSPPLPAPGIRALSSGAEAPEASRGARPGNSAARTAALRPLGWVRDEDGPVRPAH